MVQPLNLIRGLPDDGKVHLVETGPPFQIAYEGTASFLTQAGKDLPWNDIWVGPGTHRPARLLPGPIVNYIADPDLCSVALGIASVNAAKFPRPWFNHPARIKASTRDRVSRALQGIKGLVVPKVVRCHPAGADEIVAAIEEGGLRYPVLIRSAGEHGGRTLVRVDGPEDKQQLELSASAGKDLYVTEFYDFADEDGLYRRYRFAVVGGKVFIKSVIMGSHWNLHASSRIWDERTIAQEHVIISSFDQVLAPKIQPAIDAIYDRIGLDYFGIDCALRSDGSLLIFEANATMNILVDIKLKPDLWSERTTRIRTALIGLLQDTSRWAHVRQPSLATAEPAAPRVFVRKGASPRATPAAAVAVPHEMGPSPITAADILAKCADERRHRGTLERSETGQVADTYDTLHSVRMVTLILESIPASLSEADRTQYLFFILARCFDSNLAELSGWACRDLRDGQGEQAAGTLLWIERLLRLKHDIGLFGAFAVTGSAPSAPAIEPALEALSEALLAYFDRAGWPAIGSDGALDNADAALFHRAKNVLLLAKEDALGASAPNGIAPEIVGAHLECVATAAAGLAMEQATHINQFCLLHQVPELIVPTVLRLWTAIEADLDAGDAQGALENAQGAGDLLSIMVLSIGPLAEILYPSDYFRFRGNLGATSGSSSAALRGKLLTTAYVRIAERVVAEGSEQAASGRIHKRLLAQMARNRTLLYKWRALHMALPRNVLGSDGTKSLMGSPDALKAVRAMADAFAAKDPLTRLFGRIDDYDFTPTGAIARLDAALLSETGRVARDAFWQVQERVGTWAKSTKTKG